MRPRSIAQRRAVRLTRVGDPSILCTVWAYAEANRTLLAIVVVAIAIAALAYVGRRLWRAWHARSGVGP